MVVVIMHGDSDGDDGGCDNVGCENGYNNGGCSDTGKTV